MAAQRARHRKNLRIISVIDRFLEHSRIFYFRNQGSSEYYLSSADWMTRNLDRRIELMFPVGKSELQAQLHKILEFHINDNCKSRQLRHDGAYTAAVPEQPETALCRSQEAIAAWFRSMTAATLDGSAGTPLKIRKK